jgi:N-hydroxyarylamine O-acetyltransferase
MNIDLYLNRIQYKGELIPTYEVLCDLQKHHLLNVPFENLDIHYNRLIELDVNNFYEKIVVNKRGGFCYELNGLFQQLLQSIGFNTKIISANVFDSKKGVFGEKYDHLAIIVTIAELDYLVDVGFGEFTFHPLKILPNKMQEDPRAEFIIEEKEASYIVFKSENDSKTIQYKFTQQGRALEEFKEMCLFQQTSSLSHFTHKKLISIPTELGRVTMTGNTLKLTENGQEKENLEFPENEYGAQLFRWFGIEEMKINPS